MGKWLMYLYLAIATYCIVFVFISLKEEAYQLSVLLLFLALFNLALFTIFRKEVKRRKMKSIMG
ncbi:hypothetical protein ACFSO7_09735 [Bacillus sp. CGMCC 1.16607]|uniref:hypothetical protein n=1 Tax=Bacillus sp. CGMCC 1.16607 TaxID=3351842 RepID=UPI0036356721